MSKQPEQRATIRDVANRAGVSLATASRSLNDRADVHPETRAHVMRVAAELHFSPRDRRRNAPPARRHRTVGLLTSDPGGRFSMAVLQGAEDALGSGEIEVLLCAGRGDPIRERHYVRTLLERKVDGIIVVGERTNPRPSLGRGLGVPVVYAFAPSQDLDDTSFVPDEAGGAALAAEHLVALGRRRIAHINGPADYVSAQERARGVDEVMARADIALLAPTMFGAEWTQRWGRHATAMLLLSHPDVDAIVCGSDQIAVGAMETLREHGRSVPDDVAVVGFDNWEVFSADSRPTLTSVDMNLEALGRDAARALFAAMDADRTEGLHKRPCRLVSRDSTEPRGPARRD